MFCVVVCGGQHDGERIGADGWIAFYPDPACRFDNYADAQEFIFGRQASIAYGDYGVGASLGIDEIDGDIQEKF